MLRDQVGCIEKKMNWEKNIEKIKEKKMHLIAQISSTSQSCFICGPIELKFGEV